jgi:hypothetical protein
MSRNTRLVFIRAVQSIITARMALPKDAKHGIFFFEKDDANFGTRPTRR